MNSTAHATQTRDLTWLEPRDQQERCDALLRFDASLVGPDCLAGPLGQTTRDYAGQIAEIRNAVRNERRLLLAELDEKS